MKRDDLLDSIGELDPAIVEESRRVRENRKRRKNPLAVAIPIAAAALLTAGVVYAILWNSRGSSTASDSFKSGDPVETLSLEERSGEDDLVPGQTLNEADKAAEDAAKEAEAQRAAAEKAAEDAAREAEAQRTAAEKAAEDAAREAEAQRAAAEKAAEEAAREAEAQKESASENGSILPLLGMEYEINIPEKIVSYIRDHMASIRTEIMHSQFAEEEKAGKDLGNLHLLHPFVIYREDNNTENTEFSSWYFPVMSSGRIACTIVLSTLGGDITMGKTIGFNDDLNALLGDRKVHRAVLKEKTGEAAKTDSAEKETGGENDAPPAVEFRETGQIASETLSLVDLSIENTADENVFSIIPDYDPYQDRFNTHVYYYDDVYAVLRIHRDDEQRLVMMKNSKSGWETFCDIRSAKRTMCDKAEEIIAAFEDFYGYYMSVWEPKMREEKARMTDFLKYAAIPNCDDITGNGVRMKYTDQEMETIRNLVSFEFDPEMSEGMAPSFMACYAAADNGFLRLTKPVAVFRMSYAGSESADEQQLISNYFGAQLGTDTSQYYILSGFAQFDSPALYSYVKISHNYLGETNPGTPEYYLGTSFIGEWISGILD